ncbi:MAG: PQQ-dependent sugar dehydrogenase [Bacteroidia bacterium]
MIRRVAFGLLLLFSGILLGQTVQFPPGFVMEEDYVVGLNQPTDLRFAPDGRIFVTEKGGKVRIVEDGVLLDQAFYQVQTQVPYERGLDGIVLDPDFENNGYVYLYHTLPDVDQNRVIRVTAAGNTAIPGSEVEIIRFDTLWAAFHNGGSMVFDTTGKLIIGVGDGTGWFTAQPMDEILGKMLRINPDGSIPTDNPYYNTFTGRYRAIVANGIRNPYTMDISRTTGRIFFNDVGNQAWEELNEYKPASNYGWATVEGPLGNNPPPDTNYVDPLFAYDHTYGCAIVGAAFYEPMVQLFPQEYFGKYFFIEYCKGILLHIDPNTHAVTEFATGLGTYWNNIETGADGYLYMTHIFDGKIARISYRGINAPPGISVQPHSQTVPVTKSVDFNVVAQGDSMTYECFVDGAMVQSGLSDSLTLTSVTMSDDGTEVYVRISNPHGYVNSDTALLHVVPGARPSVQFIDVPATYQAGDTVRFAAQVTDADQAGVPLSDWRWKIDFHHDEHAHPTMGWTTGIDHGYFVVEHFGEVDTNVFLRIHLNATDSSGLLTESFVDVLPQKVTMMIQSIPAGIEVAVVGLYDTTNYALRSLSNQGRTVNVPHAAVVGDSVYRFYEWWDHDTSTIRSFTASNHILTMRYVLVDQYLNGVADTGNMSVYADTGLSQVFYRSHTVNRVHENWDVLSPYPFEQFPENYWSVRWKGMVYAPMTGTYTFYLRHDNHVRFYWNDSLVMEETSAYATVEVDTFELDLKAGETYYLRLDYDHYRIFARVELDWQFSVLERVPVPFSLPKPQEPIVDNWVMITAYPNPVTGDWLTYWVDADDFGEATVQLSLFDAMGKLHVQQTERATFEPQKLYVAGLETGIYFLRLRVGTTEKVIRIMRR